MPDNGFTNFSHGRGTTRFPVGPYWVLPEFHSPFFVAVRQDGKPVPAHLRGRYTSVETFRRAAEGEHKDHDLTRKTVDRLGGIVGEEIRAEELAQLHALRMKNEEHK